MDRRSFIAGATVGAAALGATAATTAPAAALTASSLARNTGRTVRLRGWLAPSDHGARHYLVLSARRGVSEPKAAHHSEWTEGLVRVFPADMDKMRTGPVEIVGRLHAGGNYFDLPTGLTAGAVLTDAKLV